MNILYVHRTQGKGVEGVHIMSIVQSLRKMGHHVDIVSPSGAGNTGGSGGKTSLLKMLTRYLPEVVFEIAELFYNFVLIRKIKEQCSVRKYDLIFERTALMTFAAVRQANCMKIPIFLEVNFTAYTPLVRDRSWFLKPVAKMIDRSNFKNASHNFVVSNYLKDHLIELGIDESRVSVVPNAADPAIFMPGTSGEKMWRVYFLYSALPVFPPCDPCAGHHQT